MLERSGEGVAGTGLGCSKGCGSIASDGPLVATSCTGCSTGGVCDCVGSECSILPVLERATSEYDRPCVCMVVVAVGAGGAIFAIYLPGRLRVPLGGFG